jgi:hypothetical protein
MSKIGYDHPPEHTRFQKGRSGNPGGRPKQRPHTINVDLDSIMFETVTVRQGGRSVTMSKTEVGLRQLLKKAIGDNHLKSAIRLLELFAKHHVLACDVVELGGVVFAPKGMTVAQFLDQANRRKPRRTIKIHRG